MFCSCEKQTCESDRRTFDIVIDHDLRSLLDGLSVACGKVLVWDSLEITYLNMDQQDNAAYLLWTFFD